MSAKRKCRRDGTALLKKLIKALPACIVILITTLGLLFGALVETGLISLPDIRDKLDFSVFDEAEPVSADSVTTEMPESAKKFRVYAVDVGQADCYIVYADGKSVLIDAGEAETSDKVISALQSLGITQPDYIIATHPHADHIGGMADVISEMGYGKLIVPKLPDDMVPTTSCYEKMLKAVSEKGLKMTAAKAGYVYDITEIDGQTVTMTVIAPTENAEYSDLNNYSVVVRIDYGSVSWLFTGDLSEEGESDILASGADIDVTALKVGHHGSRSASSEEFLAAVTPRLCLISCGSGNSYGHPTDEALSRLEEYTDKIYRTDINGTVVVYSDGSKLYVSCESSTEESQ